MARAPEALQRDRDGSRGTDLHHQIDRADIDAQFERRRGDYGAQIAVLQPRFGFQPRRARQTAMVRSDGVLAQPFRQRVGDAFGKPPRIDEYQRGAMRQDQFGKAVVQSPPTFRDWPSGPVRRAGSSPPDPYRGDGRC